VRTIDLSISEELIYLECFIQCYLYVTVVECTCPHLMYLSSYSRFTHQPSFCLRSIAYLIPRYFKKVYPLHITQIREELECILQRIPIRLHGVSTANRVHETD